MPHFIRSSASTQSSTASSRETRTRKSHDSQSSQSSNSTAPSTSSAGGSHTKTSTSTRPRTQAQALSRHHVKEDLSPATSCWPRSSVDTYASTTASEEDLDIKDDANGSIECDYQEIPALPIYTREVFDSNVRPSTPKTFAELFPSMEKLSIRHDEFTSDGNMNLRVDTVAPGRRRASYQLFHLRMYDLAKREFSLRRYSRDSGREVCNSKRKYSAPGSESRPILQRSVTSAMKTLSGKPSFRLHNSSTIPSPKQSKNSKTSNRPGSSSSWSSNSDEDCNDFFTHGASMDKKGRQHATNTIKLEFSNYARVDIHRKGSHKSKRYEFDWWGHKYSWRRVTSKHLDTVSFHLLRDGEETPIAHIVPEARSPTQILAEKQAGGWIPPCDMWITDKSVIQAATDVADVIIATGLLALTDDCIKYTWQSPKATRLSLPLTSQIHDNTDCRMPKTFMQHMFNRKTTVNRTGYDQHHSQQPSNAARYDRTASAY